MSFGLLFLLGFLLFFPIFLGRSSSKWRESGRVCGASLNRSEGDVIMMNDEGCRKRELPRKLKMIFEEWSLALHGLSWH